MTWVDEFDYAIGLVKEHSANVRSEIYSLMDSNQWLRADLRSAQDGLVLAAQYLKEAHPDCGGSASGCKVAEFLQQYEGAIRLASDGVAERGGIGKPGFRLIHSSELDSPADGELG